MNKPSLVFVEARSPRRLGMPDGLAVRDVRPFLREPMVIVKSRRSDERRGHKRFRVREGAMALVRSPESRLGPIVEKTLGDIAMAVFRVRPAKLGPIENIGEGGLSFRYTRTEHDEIGCCALDILVAERGFHLENLAFDVVSDICVTEDFDPTPKGVLTVRFRALTGMQRRRLRHFLAHHTVSPV